MGASIFNRTGLYVLMLCNEVAAKLDASWQALRVFPLVATFPRRPSGPTGPLVAVAKVDSSVGVNRSAKSYAVEVVAIVVGGFVVSRRVDCGGKSTGDRSGKLTMGEEGD